MSLDTIDIIDRLPGEMAALLETEDFFSDIPVVVAEKGNVRAEMERRMALFQNKGGKWGVAVIVLQVVADDESPELAFGPMRLKPAFQVVELVEQNLSKTGTGKSYRKVARKIAQVIKPQALVGLTTELVMDKPAIEPVPLKDELAKNVVACQVNFFTFECTDEQLSQVAMPDFGFIDGGGNFVGVLGDSVVMATNAVALHCITPGAQIWFTTDDSFPAPPSKIPTSTAQQYMEPIAIPQAGFILRARAYLPGMVASKVARETITIE